MNLKKPSIGLASVVSLLLTVLSVFSQGVHNSGLPKVDEIIFKAYPGATPETIVDEFLLGETDWIEGPGRIDLYDQVVAAGHKISSMSPIAEFSALWINCRDYKERSGEPNFPLNDSNFRVALSYIYGMDRKEADFVQYPWTYVIGNPVPPAQEPWYDETVQMPDTDWNMAWDILQANGYYVNLTDNWLWWNNSLTNHKKVRSMDVIYSRGGLGSSARVLGFWVYEEGFTQAFNEFITTRLSLDGPTITVIPTGFSTLVYDLLVYHDFDFVSIGLTNMGRFVDWMYDVLHSDNAVDWGWNFMGIVDPELDKWLEIILTSLNVTEIIEAASNVQQKFVYELMPWFPLISGSEFCSTWRQGDKELMNIISMPLYGPMNDWSWMCMHWNNSWSGGTVKVALYDEPHTLNPWNEDTREGWQMLDRAIVDLIMLDPVNLTQIPFVATEWTLDYWTSIHELGIVNGSMATFYLRQDITWHDGHPVTAGDCVNNMRIMRKYRPRRYSSVWSNLVYEEADGPYKFNVYFYTPSLYYAIYVAETALIAPKHIMDIVEQQVEDGILPSFFSWDPAYSNYADLNLGPPPAEYRS